MSTRGENLAFILFVYGLAFFAMGLAIVLEARPGSKLPLARNLWPLAAFGFLHAGVEWLDMLALIRLQESPLLGQIPLPSARMGLLVASTLALAWFGAALLAEEGGRWRLSLGIPPSLALAWLAVALGAPGLGLVAVEDRAPWAGIWARYLLYLPGCGLSALALGRQAPALRSLGMARIAGDCRWAAAAFGLNAFVAGLVVPRAGFLPASLLNYQSFTALVGLPPQVFRAAAALAITYFVVRVLRLFELQLRLERERFASQALLAQEEERKRIARELHDETAQLLSSLLVRLSLLDQAGSLDEVRKARAELVALAARAVEGVRRLALELRPPELDDLGLVEAIRWYVDDFSARSGVAASFDVEGPVARLSPVAELALYRIAQESLTNVGRHAAARHARVTLDRRGRRGAPLGGRRRQGLRRGSGPRGEGAGVGPLRHPGAGGARGRQVAGPLGARARHPRGGRDPHGGEGRAEMKRIRVLLADDHPVLRRGVRDLLGSQPDLQVVGEAGDGLEAVRLAEDLRPDVVVMDLGMPRLGGLEATRRLGARGLGCRVLVLTIHAQERYLLHVLAAGGLGYVLKTAAHEELVEAVRTVARGEPYLRPEAARLLVGGYLERVRGGQERDSFAALTERERQVLQLTAEGHTAQEIADQLVISANTVETYRRRVMEKLNLHRRADLVRYALQRGLLVPPE